MSLILLYLGDTCRRYPTEDEAKKSGSIHHTKNTPARIEITPDGGGVIIEMKYDPNSKAWI